MSPLLSLVKIELGPSYDDLMSVLDKIFDEFLEIESPWTSVHKSHIVYRET